MGVYVVFTQLTPAGRKRLHDNPDRAKEVARQVERLGAKITAQYSTLGQHDFISVVEAPDDGTLERVKVELGALGTMRNHTYPAIAMPRFQQLLKLAPYRTEPHAWQTSPWASALRRAGRYWVTTRHVRKFCQPFTVEGREHIKGFKGGAVVIANHSSHMDTPVVLETLPPNIRNHIVIAAAADKFYASRRKRHWWYSLFHGTFPVHRGGGVKQLEYPLSLLRRGWSLLIFPEGGRSRSGQVQRFKAGPAIMAMQAKVPVIPVYIEGLRNVMPKGQREPRPAEVHARIGAPIHVAEAESVQEAITMMENAMRELAGMPPHRATAPAETELAAAPTSGGG